MERGAQLQPPLGAVRGGNKDSCGLGHMNPCFFFKAQDMTETNNNNSFVPALKINAGMLNILFINSFCYYNNEYFFAFFIFKLNCFRLKYRLTV